jgi:hypothetical protein
VAEFVDGIASETQTDYSAAAAADDDENLMKKLGIPTGFTTTKVSPHLHLTLSAYAYEVIVDIS